MRRVLRFTYFGLLFRSTRVYSKYAAFTLLADSGHPLRILVSTGEHFFSVVMKEKAWLEMFDSVFFLRYFRFGRIPLIVRGGFGSYCCRAIS